ncbi:hypothetical protein CLOP_g1305 [Closterium sp. NIES-67]|nr:hypothetical protein CLOP_g1305 [Closterium sp. NIES-67]
MVLRCATLPLRPFFVTLPTATARFGSGSPHKQSLFGDGGGARWRDGNGRWKGLRAGASSGNPAANGGGNPGGYAYGYSNRPPPKPTPTYEEQVQQRMREVTSMPFDVARRLWRLITEQPEEFRLVRFPSWKEMITVTLLTFLFIIVLIIFISSVDSVLARVLTPRFKPA